MFLICSSEGVLGCALNSLSKKWKVPGICGSGMNQNKREGILKNRHDIRIKRIQYIDVAEDSQPALSPQLTSVQ